MGALVKVAERAGPLFQEHGLELEVSKSELIGERADCVDIPSGFKTSCYGGRILGAPVGQPSYVFKEYEAKVKKAFPPNEAIAALDKRCAFRLLFYSYNSLLIYLSRVCEFEEGEAVHPVLKLFDKQMDACLGILVGAEEGTELERVAQLREQKQSRAGLGMQRYYGISTERNKILSRGVTRAFVKRHHPGLVQAMKDVWGEIRMGKTDGEYLDAEGVNPGAAIDRPDTPQETLSRETRNVVQLSLKNRFDKLHNQLNSTGETAHAAYLLSAASKGTGRWLLSTAGLEPGNGYFDGQLFGKMLRRRLLLPMWREDGRRPPMCACLGPGGVARTDLRHQPHHEQTCHQTNATRTRRHHQIRDLVADLIKKVYAVGVETEVQYTRQDDKAAWSRCNNRAEQQSRRTKFIVDIEFVKDGKRHMVDIGIVCPASLTAIERDEANTKSAAAASAEELRKGIKYSQAFPGIGRSFSPFILEATGRYGPAAAAFLELLKRTAAPEMQRNAAQAVEKFHAAVAMELARTGAWLIQSVDASLV
jgi:hypothetical protein